MKKIKFLLLFLIVITLTGCSGTYNITINKDLTVDEEANISVKKDDNSYKKIKDLFSNNNISEEKYEIKEVNDKLKINYKENYSSVGDYISNSVLYSELFDITDYSMNTSNISILANSKFKNDVTANLPNISNSFDISNLIIGVKTPFNTANNADESSGDKSIWKIDSNTTSKTISLDISLLENTFGIKSFIIPIISIIALVVVGILYHNFNKKNNTDFY